MPSETGITSILGVEKEVNKNQLNGYAGLDTSGYISVNEISYISLIPNVFVDGIYPEHGLPEDPTMYAPFMDDAPTFSNLIFVADGHYISFDNSTHCISMRKT